MATANTQFYKGCVAMNGIQLPVLPGVRLSAPHNWDLPPIAGNYVQSNRGEGARNAVLTFQLAVLEGSMGFLLGSGGIMDALLARTDDAAHDTYSNYFQFHDGRIVWELSGAKVERVSLSCARGQRLTMDITVVAPSLNVINSAPSPTASTYFSNAGQVVTFAGINFLGYLTDHVVSFELGYTNNHTPDPTINGYLNAAPDGHPNAMNASTATGTLGLTFQLADATDSSREYGGMVGQGESVAFRVRAASGTYSDFFTGGLVMQNPNDRSLTMPRQFVSTAYNIIGGNGGLMQWTTSINNPLLRLSTLGASA